MATLTIRDRGPRHLVLQPPPAAAAAPRGLGLHRGLAALPPLGAAAFVLKVRVGFWLGARVGHRVLVIIPGQHKTESKPRRRRSAYM